MLKYYFLDFQPLLKRLKQFKVGRRNIFKAKDWSVLEKIIGIGFDWRIANRFSDFAAIERNTFEVY